MTINDLSDKQLADMVRNSLYAKNTRFGDGPSDSRFLLVLAVPYGNDENVTTLPGAIEGFARLLQDDDWSERELQVYDHSASQQFYTATYDEVAHQSDDDEDDTCQAGICSSPAEDGSDYCYVHGEDGEE